MAEIPLICVTWFCLDFSCVSHQISRVNSREKTWAHSSWFILHHVCIFHTRTKRTWQSSVSQTHFPLIHLRSARHVISILESHSTEMQFLRENSSLRHLHFYFSHFQRDITCWFRPTATWKMRLNIPVRGDALTRIRIMSKSVVLSNGEWSLLQIVLKIARNKQKSL